MSKSSVEAPESFPSVSNPQQPPRGLFTRLPHVFSQLGCVLLYARHHLDPERVRGSQTPTPPPAVLKIQQEGRCRYEVTSVVREAGRGVCEKVKTGVDLGSQRTPENLVVNLGIGSAV